MKTADANPRMSFFEKCFKSWFDTLNARSRREDPCCIFFMDTGAFCVELRPFYCNKRISAPMSYISWLGIDVYPNVSRYTPSFILLTITNGTTPNRKIFRVPWPSWSPTQAEISQKIRNHKICKVPWLKPGYILWCVSTVPVHWRNALEVCPKA